MNALGMTLIMYVFMAMSTYTVVLFVWIVTLFAKATEPTTIKDVWKAFYRLVFPVIFSVMFYRLWMIFEEIYVNSA